jgi:hypothetical protein
MWAAQAATAQPQAFPALVLLTLVAVVAARTPELAARVELVAAETAAPIAPLLAQERQTRAVAAVESELARLLLRAAQAVPASLFLRSTSHENLSTHGH